MPKKAAPKHPHAPKLAYRDPQFVDSFAAAADPDSLRVFRSAGAAAARRAWRIRS